MVETIVEQIVMLLNQLENRAHLAVNPDEAEGVAKAVMQVCLSAYDVESLARARAGALCGKGRAA